MNLPSILLGTGILCWNGYERRSDRYGAFYLADASYNGERSESHPCLVHAMRARSLVGKRVRLVAKSVERRKSGHCGDLFHKIYPAPLATHHTIEIGVGILHTGQTETKETTFELHPEDGRATFWIDPRILFQLHDQTVELYAEESAAPAHAPFVAAPVAEDAAIGVDDSAVQMKSTSASLDNLFAPPSIERLDKGLFSLTQQAVAPGKRIKLERR